MKLKRIYLKYFPPGLGFEYEKSNKNHLKILDLLEFKSSSDVEEWARNLEKNETVVAGADASVGLRRGLQNIQSQHLRREEPKTYRRHWTLRTHVLAFTNAAFDRPGHRCATGSYDRTCKIWNLENGSEIATLIGHKNVVFSVAFNNPYSDLLATGSFDRTVRIWRDSECLHTLWGHMGEVTVVRFSLRMPQHLATGSMDCSARIFDVHTGQEIFVARGHTDTIVGIEFSQDGQFLTGSFDGTVSIWDPRVKRRVSVLVGHHSQISQSVFSPNDQLIASCSLDKTVRIWDCRTFTCLQTLQAHKAEVFDIAFDYSTHRLASATGNGEIFIWDCQKDFGLKNILKGHSEEVCKVVFSPCAAHLLSASADRTARLWNHETAECFQILDNHRDEVIHCSFDYTGDAIFTISKDNMCRVWR